MDTNSVKIWTGHLSQVLLGVLVIAVYWPVLQNQFLMQWDQTIVMNMYTESSLSWRNLWDVMTTFHAGQYAPVNELFYMLL